MPPRHPDAVSFSKLGCQEDWHERRSCQGKCPPWPGGVHPVLVGGITRPRAQNRCPVLFLGIFLPISRRIGPAS